MNKNFLDISNSREVEIKSCHMGTNFKTGEQFQIITLSNGKTYIETLFTGKQEQTDVRDKREITIPSYQTIEERREVVRYLYYKGYTQDVIAYMLNICQATVSNDLKAIGRS